MNEVNSVSVHKIGKAGGTSNSSDTDDFFVRNSEFLDDIKEGGKYRKVAAGGTPGRVICFELLLCELFGGGG